MKTPNREPIKLQYGSGGTRKRRFSSWSAAAGGMALLSCVLFEFWNQHIPSDRIGPYSFADAGYFKAFAVPVATLGLATTALARMDLGVEKPTGKYLAYISIVVAVIIAMLFAGNGPFIRAWV